VARDRQSAKRRQAQRREERLRAQAERSRQRSRGGDGTGAEAPGRLGADGSDGRLSERELEGTDAGASPAEELDPATRARLAAGAPPEDAGRSDTVVESPPPAPDLEAGDELEPAAPRRERRAEASQRGRVTAFLVAVWAELQRVQWPDRRTLTTLTGVVLGFVLIAGGYLGLLDGLLQAFFSRLLGAGP
jgi:preprotein translocase SecE subunit